MWWSWAGKQTIPTRCAARSLRRSPSGFRAGLVCASGRAGRGDQGSAKRARCKGTMGQMKIERKFTSAETGAYGEIAFTTTTSEIRNPDGKVVFRNEAVEVPDGWSQVAADAPLPIRSSQMAKAIRIMPPRA
mgnify:CR=1 FL=1